MRRLVSIGLSIALLVGAAGVRAQSAEDLETARELFKQATELYDAHDVKGALAKFKVAHALANTPVTGVELAKTYVELGMLAEGREVALGVEKIPVKPNESEKTKKARADAGALAGSLRDRLASLTVVVDNAPSGTVAQVTIDGTVIPGAALATARKVNPGAHTIAASIGNAPATTTDVTLGEGEARTLHVTVSLPQDVPVPVTPAPVPPAPVPLPPATPAPAAPEYTRAPAPAASAPEPSGEASASLLKYAGLSAALGIGSAVAGGAFGAAVLAEKADVDSHCNEFKQCDETGLGAAKTAKDLATASTVFFAVGGALGGVAIVLGVLGLVTAPRARSAESARILVAPTAGGFVVGTTGVF